MIAPHYVQSDGPLHFDGQPITDSRLDAIAEAGPGDFGADSTMPRSPQEELRVWREEAERALRGGDARQALRCWRVVRQLQPEALDALFHIGCCQALVGQTEEASRMFDALVHMRDAPRGLRQRAARLAALLEPASD